MRCNADQEWAVFFAARLATEQVQQRYITVVEAEMREGIGEIISLAGVPEVMGKGTARRA